MDRLIERATMTKRLAEYLSDPDNVAGGVADPTVTLEAWLKRLEMLHGVPFNYLVPSPRMLPNESIRFFNVDLNWLFALIEGACSIGDSIEMDQTQHAVTGPALHAAAANLSTAHSTAPDKATGFLMRSQVVAGWPKLEVVAFDAKGNELTNVLRMDRLSSSILMFMVEGRIDHVIIREPAVGLHFGVDIKGGKFLRFVTVPKDAPAGALPGDQIPDSSVTPQYRNSGHRTIRINQLAGHLAEALYHRGANNGPDGKKLPFTSAEFALELVEGTQEVTFQCTPDEDR